MMSPYTHEKLLYHNIAGNFRVLKTLTNRLEFRKKTFTDCQSEVWARQKFVEGGNIYHEIGFTREKFPAIQYIACDNSLLHSTHQLYGIISTHNYTTVTKFA